MYYALALFAVVLSALSPGFRLPIRVPPAVRRALAGPAVVPVAVCVLVAAQGAYLRLLLAATYHQHPERVFMTHMPVRFISGLGAFNIAESYRTGFALLVVFESCALIALYFGLARPTRVKLFIVALGILASCADATLSRAATSADMYSYVGYALLGARAYAPPATAFAGAYGLINVWWRTPLAAAPYGPLGLALCDCAAFFGHTLFAKIVALRLLGACALLGTAGILAALKVPPRIVALVALNPALIFEFVANAHNDLLGVLLLLAARYAAARGGTRLGIVFAVLGGLVKLPFLLLGALAFAPLKTTSERVRAWALAASAGLALSWLGGGRGYAEALYRHANDSTSGHALAALEGLPGAVKAVALGAVALALATGIFVEGCAWTLPALGALLHPWYLGWTLPYAVASETMLRNLAIALPVAMLFADAAIGDGKLVAVLETLAMLWLAVPLARNLAGRLPLRESHA